MFGKSEMHITLCQKTKRIMKKLVFCLMALLAIVACSSDDDKEVTPKQGEELVGAWKAELESDILK